MEKGDSEMEEKIQLENSTCKVCKKKFRTAEKLSLHMGFHSLFGSFKKGAQATEQNTSEGLETGSNSAVDEDNEEQHEVMKTNTVADIAYLVEKPFPCSQCSLRFSSMRNQMQHELLHDRKISGIGQRGAYTSDITCRICKQKCRTEGGLQKHFELAHVSQSVQCTHCQKKFRNRSLLEAHKSSVHPDSNNNEKDGCDKETISTGKSQNVSWKAKQLSSMKSKYSRVNVQRDNHTTVRFYECKACGKRYRFFKLFISHLKKAHGSVQSVQKSSCKQCDMSFTNEKSLNNHVTTHHRSKSKKNATILSNNFTCEECGAVFENLADIRQHLRLNHSLRCKYKFEQQLKGYRRYRIRDCNTGGLTYQRQCIYCDKLFLTMRSVCMHIQKEHHSNMQVGVNSGTTNVPTPKLPAKKLQKIDAKVVPSEERYMACEEGSTSGTARKLLKTLKHASTARLRDKSLDATYAEFKSKNLAELKSISDAKLELANMDEKLAEEARVVDPKSGKPVENIDLNNPSVDGGIEEPSTKSKKDESMVPNNYVGRKNRKRLYFSSKYAKTKSKTKDVCRCPDCDVVLDTEWDLEQHYKYKHSGANYEVVPKFSPKIGKYNLFVKCLICGKICRSKGALHSHLKQHKNEKKRKKREKKQCAFEEKQKEEANATISYSKDDFEHKPAKAKRKQSCIYHCRICGKSFDRLYSYSEHSCACPDPDPGPGPLNEKLADVGDDAEKSVAKTPLESAQQAIDIPELIEQVVTSNEVILNSADFSDLSILEDSSKSTLPIQQSQAATSCNDKNKPNEYTAVYNSVKTQCLPLRKQKEQETLIKSPEIDQTNRCCRYCKVAIRDATLLSKHEATHAEYSGYICSVCGMGFDAVHKLRYHQVRCSQSSSSPRGNVGNEKGNCLENVQLSTERSAATDGFLEGKTYPSFVSTKEYKIFDPVNKSKLDDRSQDVVANGNSCSDSGTDGYSDYSGCREQEREIDNRQGKQQSCLDEIRIADVRSVHPSVPSTSKDHQASSDGKHSPPDSGPAFAPAYFFGPPGKAVPLQMAHQLNIMHDPSPPPNLHANGTVFFVPYFVPTGEDASKYFPREIFNVNCSLPANVSRLEDVFTRQLGPTGFDPSSNESVQPTLTLATDTDSRLKSQHESETRLNSASLLKTEHQRANNKKAKNDNEQTKVAHRHQCTVCQRGFNTFGSFVKHRESHR